MLGLTCRHNHYRLQMFSMQCAPRQNIHKTQLYLLSNYLKLQHTNNPIWQQAYTRGFIKHIFGHLAKINRKILRINTCAAKRIHVGLRINRIIHYNKSIMYNYIGLPVHTHTARHVVNQTSVCECFNLDSKLNYDIQNRFQKTSKFRLISCHFIN